MHAVARTRALLARRPDPRTQSAAAKRRDGYRCQGCGAPKPLTVHHIRPRELGGTNDLRNLLTLCVACHDYVEPDAPGEE